MQADRTRANPVEPQCYQYVGSQGSKELSEQDPEGIPMNNQEMLLRWIKDHPESLDEGITYVVDLEKNLIVAPRRSEHVRCAKGRSVLAAGELTFGYERETLSVVAISNLSTGYCPDKSCWTIVEESLHRLNIECPSFFTEVFEFRYCSRCSQISLVKDQWFYCVYCESDLAPHWNIDEKYSRKT